MFVKVPQPGDNGNGRSPSILACAAPRDGIAFVPSSSLVRICSRPVSAASVPTRGRGWVAAKESCHATSPMRAWDPGGPRGRLGRVGRLYAQLLLRHSADHDGLRAGHGPVWVDL